MTSDLQTAHFLLEHATSRVKVKVARDYFKDQSKESFVKETFKTNIRNKGRKSVCLFDMGVLYFAVRISR